MAARNLFYSLIVIIIIGQFGFVVSITVAHTKIFGHHHHHQNNRGGFG